MSNISAAMVKELREKSGAGMMDCKAALTECDGDIEKAMDFLRKKALPPPPNGRVGRLPKARCNPTSTWGVKSA